MQLKSITLENFGAYRKKNTIAFSINNPKKNIILIGGQNGAGKTTLLNAIKIALFGPYAYGYKTENSKPYIEKITNYLNTNAIKNNENQFSITLDFSEVEDYKKADFSFTRSWKLKGNNFGESLVIKRDNIILNETEKELYQSKLNENMPPELFDLCLFDGEEISRIINDNLLSTYLQNLSRVVFNLSLFENLENDLDTFSTRKVNSDQASKVDKEIIELKNLVNEKTEVIKDFQSKINHKEEVIAKLSSDLSSIEKDFETHGGLYKEQRDELLVKLNTIENRRKEINNEVKEYIATILPFYINKELLEETTKQLEDENTQKIFKEFSKSLSEDKLNKIQTDLGLENQEDKLKNSLLAHMKPEKELILHDASNDQRNKVFQMNSMVSINTSDYYTQLLKENQDLLEEAQNIKKKLKTHDETNEFTQMIKQIEQLKSNIEKEENTLEELKLLLTEHSQNVEELQVKLEERQKERHKQSKQMNAFGLLDNLINTSKQFREIQVQKKLQEVESEALRMLKRLMRKQNYISHLSISHEDYEIYVYNQSMEEHNINNLSAGEKEIILLSIIWAMFKASGRRVPFIYDTLLGRLDKKHKATVLSELLPSSGEQTLVLSTDTEIDEKHYNLVEPYLSQAYTLDFNNETQSVTIHDEYLFINEEDGVRT
ncbi:DNA sulfur modification protein DndD [Allobacillus sp. GCM10007491]|uniref:Nuclease SbcCD subunit C n=1 Tax=Allobacillus saliphilus TaxID=2912308 RepID=A0A941HSQ0_9BACI|nr:DNA sulfur modification protein DndD [Allobacillus saliphilus]MBR7553628.1 DNA sulfur modification protein DndD [Allobacillus saliphilus]